MIKVKDLTYSYKEGKESAIKDINFEVKEGEIFGFLGPSGAGKSTTQSILTGLLKLQKGRANVAGYDIKKIDRKMFNEIGMSFEQANVYNKMTAKENLEFYKKLFDCATKDSDYLLKLVGLDGKENIKAGNFSKGMKHRLVFARSMINNPKVWFLDEPTTGLDPAIASTIKKIIREENKKGVTIFLTTHNMQIADELCDRVAFIVDGEIKLIDSPSNLKLKYGDKSVDIDYIDKKGNEISKNYSLEKDAAKINGIINENKIKTMHTKEATLEEIFIKVTGKELL